MHLKFKTARIGSLQTGCDLCSSAIFIKLSYISLVNFSAVAIKPFDSINHAMEEIFSAADYLTITFLLPISLAPSCYVYGHVQH